MVVARVCACSFPPSCSVTYELSFMTKLLKVRYTYKQYNEQLTGWRMNDLNPDCKRYRNLFSLTDAC